MKATICLLVITISISGISQPLEVAQLEKFIKEITSIDSISKRIDAKNERIKTKDSLVIKLSLKRNSIMQSEDSEKKKYRLSLITYELFVAESRLADEKIKLWQLEQFKMIQENLNKPDINEQVQEYAQNLANLRNSEADRLSDRAQELVPSITETLYLNQFNLFLNSIKLN